jgi:hypothetical protein
VPLTDVKFIVLIGLRIIVKRLGEQGAEEDIWTQEEGSGRRLEKTA